MKTSCMLFIDGLLIIVCSHAALRAQVTTSQQLADAMKNSPQGSTILLGAGVFEISEPLRPKAGFTIKGAGAGKTIIQPTVAFKADSVGLPQTDNPEAYLISCSKVSKVTISNMTLRGPNLHGAIYAFDSDTMTLHNLQIENFFWCGIRTYNMDYFKVHDNVFINAGGRVQWIGAAIFSHWSKYSEFWNNRISKTDDYDNPVFGFKGIGGKHLRFHHNTVNVSFSLEYPFNNDQQIEIDHNILNGVISVPKRGGGPVLDTGYSFHIHHNVMLKSYSIELARNSIIVEYNLFDFDTLDDKGNLMGSHGTTVTSGPAIFRHNNIKNPARGIFWSMGPYNGVQYLNNHIISNTHARETGFFGFNPETDFSTILIKNNIIENIVSNPRPLMRNKASYGAVISNNLLVNITDTGKYANAPTGAARGPEKPLYFKAGVNEEVLVDGWSATAVTTALSRFEFSPAKKNLRASSQNVPLNYIYTLHGQRLEVAAGWQARGNGMYIVSHSGKRVSRVVIQK